MYERFKYERVALSLIQLDNRNPRIVTQEKLASESDIAAYLFEHEELAQFIKMIANEGRNPGAERPYVIKDGKNYVVIEGNTRIAAYKLLTQQLIAPEAYENLVPRVAKEMQEELVSVDVAIAPSRDSLMTIMARAHFGRGDKSGWGYLGSRKAVFDDWKSGKSIGQLANVFGRSQSQIRELILEYRIYLEALELSWTSAEREVLLRPSIEFNPPVRFLQTAGHKELVGIELDRVNLEVKFIGADAKSKFKYLVKRTAIDDKGPSATATYADVFSGYKSSVQSPSGDQSGGSSSAPGSSSQGSSGQAGGGGTVPPGGSGAQESSAGGAGSGVVNPKPHALFNYDATKNDLTLHQLLKEAKGINIKNFPGAGSALLRSVLELCLKLIIEEKKLNPQGLLHDLEKALNVVIGQGNMSADDVRLLREFKISHLAYINLSSHATQVPNHFRLISARDCITSFVKRNV